MIEQLNRIEEKLEELLRLKPAKEFYTTAEVAERLERAEYTVREKCREGKIKARKSPNGRGWLIPHSELQRLRNGGVSD